MRSRRSHTLLWRTLSRRALVSGVFAWLAFSAVPIFAADLTGRVTLVENGEKKSDREVTTAVVYFVPENATRPSAPSEPFQIAMTRKSFVPRVLAVPVGSRVRFPNDDRILHNVFSLSRGNRFDLGLYRRGESKEAVMKSPGVVQIFCNVHHSMVAYVLALDTPYFTQPDGDGRFELKGLPDGPGRLEVWHERADQRSVEISVQANRTAGINVDLDIQLEITKPRVPPHRNKFGKPYKRRRGKAY